MDSLSWIVMTNQFQTSENERGGGEKEIFPCYSVGKNSELLIFFFFLVVCRTFAFSKQAGNERSNVLWSPREAFGTLNIVIIYGWFTHSLRRECCAHEGVLVLSLTDTHMANWHNPSPSPQEVRWWGRISRCAYRWIRLTAAYAMADTSREAHS